MAKACGQGILHPGNVFKLLYVSVNRSAHHLFTTDHFVNTQPGHGEDTWSVPQHPNGGSTHNGDEINKDTLKRRYRDTSETQKHLAFWFEDIYKDIKILSKSKIVHIQL